MSTVYDTYEDIMSNGMTRQKRVGDWSSKEEDSEGETCEKELRQDQAENSFHRKEFLPKRRAPSKTESLRPTKKQTREIEGHFNENAQPRLNEAMESYTGEQRPEITMTNNGERETTIGNLPEEILLQILSQLDSPCDWSHVFLVSSNWNRIARLVFLPSRFHSIGLRNAVRSGNASLVKRLLNDPQIDPSALHSESLQLAAKSGNISIVSMLLEAGVDPSDDFNFAITWASLHGHTEIVQRLLQDPRVDPSSGNNRALTFACIHGHVEIIRTLLKDSRTRPPNGNHICWAVSNGHADVVRELLLDERINPCIDNNFAMHLAAMRGDAAMLDILLRDTRVKRELMRSNAVEHSS